MEDTPQHIKDLQLKIWLSKSPMERLRQCIVDSEQFYKMIDHAKEGLKKKNDEINGLDTKH